MMMAASLKEGDEVVDLLLRKGADVNAKSTVKESILCFTATDSVSN